MPLSIFVPTQFAVIRMLKVAALAAVGTDPVQAVRLAFTASELRAVLDACRAPLGRRP